MTQSTVESSNTSAAAQDTETDPDAPYGRKPDGTPYKRSPEWRAGVGQRLAAARWAKPTGTKSTGAKRKPAAPPTDYRPGVRGLLQMPAFGLAVLGRHNHAYTLDSAAISLHAAGIADAVHETAMIDDRVAAALDKLLTIGPYGALFAAVLPLALQIAANHKVIPTSPEMGILGETDLVNTLAQAG